MDRNLFKYIWRYSKQDQLFILMLVLGSLPFYFLSLSLPKQIINQGIQGEGYAGPGSTQKYFTITMPGSEKLYGEPVVVFEGFDLEQMALLFALSFTFLALVIVNGVFKFIINTLKGRLGERLLRRLRYQLTDRVLRFPIPQLRKVRQAEVATMIKDEVEPLGGFIGEAFMAPVFLGGQAITAMIFILLQNVWLGLVAAVIVLAQGILIPKLRVRILQLGRQRQLTARQLAGRIGELVAGAVEIHANDTSNYERADVASRLGKIFAIRYEIFQRKFFVKFLNNFMSQLTPFIFYAAGGYLAITGRLDIGALVAVLNAYKDLPAPIKELIDWEQQRNDVQIKYEQVIEQFNAPGLIEPEIQELADGPIPALGGKIEVAGLSLKDEAGTSLLNGITFDCNSDEHLAIIGPSGSGKDHLTMVLAGLLRPTGGRVMVAGQDLRTLGQRVTGRRLSYVGGDAYLFPLSVKENLLYGLKHQPLRDVDYEGEAQRDFAAYKAESLRAGNTTLDIHADWIDYSAAGASGNSDLAERMVDMLRVVDLEEDVYRFGLQGTIDPESQPELAQGILEARSALFQRLTDAGDGDLVIRFDPQRYNDNATLAENILFGTPVDRSLEPESLALHPLVGEILAAQGLTDDLEKMAVEIAQTMVEIFADLPPGHPFFEQFSFISFDDLPIFRTLITRIEQSGIEALSGEERTRLLALSFRYIKGRHRLGLTDGEFEARVLAARQAVVRRLAEEPEPLVAFYDPEKYNAAATLQDNILFGRLAFGRAQAAETVGEATREVLDSLNLRNAVIEVGLEHEVGVGGKRLNATQRQKLAVARALIKKPDVLIVNEALGGMDEVTQTRILRQVLDASQGRGVIWALQRAEAAQNFGSVLVMDEGRLVRQGSFEEITDAAAE